MKEAPTTLNTFIYHWPIGIDYFTLCCLNCKSNIFSLSQVSFIDAAPIHISNGTLHADPTFHHEPALGDRNLRADHGCRFGLDWE